MKKFCSQKVILFLLATTLLFSSCASSTLIQSYPSGARVYVNGQERGLTPYWHTDHKMIGAVTNIDILKDGYEPLYTYIERTEQVNAGAIIGGLFCWPLLAWSMQYDQTHNFELKPLAPSAQIAPQQDAILLSPQPIANTQGSAQVQNTATTKIQKLRELKQMLDENLINKEDFEKQKQRILEGN